MKAKIQCAAVDTRGRQCRRRVRRPGAVCTPCYQAGRTVRPFDSAAAWSEARARELRADTEPTSSPAVNAKLAERD